MAGSEGTTFTTGADGQITASNNANGAGSTNTANASSTTNNTTTQNNTANINNTLNLSANTGNNKENFNTGGNNNIQTGDATVIANLVNFVNNNVVGNGKLVVTVINVFGSWLGDFVAPGQKKQEHTTAQATGTTNNNASSNNSSNNASNTSNNQNTVTVQGLVAGIQKVFTESSSQGTTNNGSTQVSSGTVAVAGISTSASQHDSQALIAGKSKKSISINLAWFLLLIPLVGLFVASKKIKLAQLLQKKN